MVSWSWRKKKEEIFCSVYFVRRKSFWQLCSISMYSVLNTLSENTYFIYQKTLLRTLFCFFKKSVESLPSKYLLVFMASLRRLQDIKIYRSKHFLFSKTSWRRLHCNNFLSSKTSSRRLQDVFVIRLPKTFSKRLQDVYKTSSRCLRRRLQDVLKTSLRHISKTSCKYVLKTS